MQCPNKDSCVNVCMWSGERTKKRGKTKREGQFPSRSTVKVAADPCPSYIQSWPRHGLLVTLSDIRNSETTHKARAHTGEHNEHTLLSL